MWFNYLSLDLYNGMMAVMYGLSVVMILVSGYGGRGSCIRDGDTFRGNTGKSDVAAHKDVEGR